MYTSTSALPTDVQPHIVIIGGGITGLSAAFALQQNTPNGVQPRYTLIERDTRLGGKIRTEIVQHNGTFVVEAGPDSILTQKPWGVGLARALGLGDMLVGSNQQHKTVYVLTRGKLEPMPEGMLLAVPLNLRAFLRSRLLSPLGRLRVLMDLVLPGRRDAQDESLGGFIRRRFGQEALERMAAPLMSGIHNAECDRQSLLATFPRFHAVERTYGSLIRGLWKEQQAARTKSQAANGSKLSAFVSFPQGVQQLVDTLASQLTGNIITGVGVSEIEQPLVGSAAYRIRLENGETLDADVLIVTTPAHTTADLLEALQPDLASALREMRYVSTATVSLAFKKAEVGELIDGYGVLVPSVEKRQINALTMSSVKFTHRAPEHMVLIRAFVGGSHNPGIMELDDDAMLAAVRGELQELWGVTAEPVFTRVFRWNNANPQYDIGHLERVAAYEAQCPEGLYLAGCAYRGVGIPDCIHQGQEAARQARAFVEQLVQVA
jgi:oxygen-dependent protoporphyrinogen oxidase